MPEETQTPVGAVSADPVHEEGTEHIKEQVAKNQEGEQTTGEGTAAAATTTEPESTVEPTVEPAVEPIVEPKPPASNPGSPDASGGIAKGAGGVSGAAHVGSPVSSKDKRKSIVGTLKGFLGFDKKEKEAADAGTTADTTVIGTATAAVSSAVGYVTGQTAEVPDRTKAPTNPDAAAVPSSEESKPAESKDQADTGALTASSAPEESSTAKKDESTDQKVSETDNDGGEDKQFTEKASSKGLENRDAIPTAGGEKLGEKHWGESDIVPENPKQGGGESGGGVASSEGQPTGEVADNTAKNTGGASGGPAPAASGSAAAPEKQKFSDKLRKKLPFGKKE